MVAKDFYTALENRRSYYGISKESVISDEKIQDVVNRAVKHAPSAFNSQTSRAVVLLGEHHNKLWDITKEALRKIVSEDQFAATEEKMNAFRNGYGTIMFFEDQSVIETYQKDFAPYKDKFPEWSQQASGMLQFIVWTALESEGLGASLQHYNPIIDDEVRKEWNIPANWRLIAELPFGNPTVQPGEKTFQPLEDRIKVFK